MPVHVKYDQLYKRFLVVLVLLLLVVYLKVR